jgi:hypothetical protein
MRIILIAGDELYVESTGKFPERRKLWCTIEGNICEKGVKVI